MLPKHNDNDQFVCLWKSIPNFNKPTSHVPNTTVQYTYTYYIYHVGEEIVKLRSYLLIYDPKNRRTDLTTVFYLNCVYVGLKKPVK